MANSLGRQITHDGYRNAVVKLTGFLDTSDISETPAVALGDFTGNDPAKTLVGFRVDIVEFSISNGIEVQLAWNALNPQQIMPLSGRGRINAWNYGGFHPDPSQLGYDGSINLITSGYNNQAGPQTFTVVLELIKQYV